MKYWLIKWHDGYNFFSMKFQAPDIVSAIHWSQHKYSMSHLISVELIPTEQS